MKRGILALALLAAGSTGCLQEVKSGEVGVKTSFTFVGNGIHRSVFRAQQHIVIPWFQRMDTFSIREQKYDMVARLQAAADSDTQRLTGLNALSSREGDAVRLKTSDGNDVYVDVTVIFQLIPEKAPHVLQYFGPEDRPGNYFETLIRPTCRSVIRSELGELTTEEMYNARLRQKKADEAQAVLNERFNRHGLQVLEVLVREFRFNEDYQRAIEEKKLADQQAEENKSLALAAEQDALRKKNAAIGQANAAIEEAKGFLGKTRLEADARVFSRNRDAQGLLAQRKAEAEGVRLSAKAMEGEGGRTLVARTIAESLQGKRMLLLPTAGGGALQVTDINDLLSRFAAVKAIPDRTAPPQTGTAPPQLP